jgi:hypothetical protein
MRVARSLIWVSFMLPVLSAADRADAQMTQAAYAPIRQVVARGRYYSPNYLTLVKATVGREDAYRMMQTVLSEHYGRGSTRYGRDNYLVYALRKSRSYGSRQILLGRFAEERIIEVNPEQGWQKVKDRFAKQRDVWRRVNGNIEYGQLKVHGLGKTNNTLPKLGNEYIRSMRKDSGRGQASQFLVPDDHVEVIETQLSEKRTTAVRRGDSGEVVWLDKQQKRLQPMGVDYATLDGEATLAEKAAKARIVAKWAGPAITVAFLLGKTGYDAYRWHNGGLSDSGFLVQVGKTGSTFTVGFGTGYLLAKSEWFKSRPLRAGGVVTIVLFLAEEAWLVHQYGGFNSAFSSPPFLVQSSGNLGAAAFGLVGMFGGAKLGVAAGAWFGPQGATIGGLLGGIAGGAAAGAAGYWGGAKLSNWLLETLDPEFYYGMKTEQVDKAKSRFQQEIDRLRDLSRPLVPSASLP